MDSPTLQLMHRDPRVLPPPQFRAINLLLFLLSSSFFLNSPLGVSRLFLPMDPIAKPLTRIFFPREPLPAFLPPSPESKPSCLWREMGRRSYCGSATSSPASGEWRNKLEASRLSCGEAMDDEETVFNETHYIYCV